MHSFTPILAEIADKMPTLDVVWERWIIIGLFAAFVTAGLSMFRLWFGGLVVVLSVLLGLLAAAPDGIMDGAIVQELGADYLFQQRVSGFVPSLLALVAWIIVWLFRRPNTALEPTADSAASSASRPTPQAGGGSAFGR
jgi:hypothetical protein